MKRQRRAVFYARRSPHNHGHIIYLSSHVPSGLTALHKVNVNATPDAPVTEDGAKSVKIKWLISEKDGAPNFLMRHFTVEAGGFTPLHSHEWEHEVYVLEGTGKVRYEDHEEKIEPGDAIFIPPNRTHQFQADSEKPLKFLCMVPK